MLFLLVLLLPYILYRLYLAYRPISYKGKTVWITGASSGIGEFLAYEFASLGAFVLLSGRNLTELNRVKSKIPDSSAVIPLDLSDSSTVISKASSILSQHKVDILVNNAGVSQRSLFADSLSGIEIERQLMEVNYFSVIAMTKAFLKHLSGRSGQVVVVSSMAGVIAGPTRSGYGAAKAGISGYYESLRGELRGKNIDVIDVLPGFVKTNISKSALNYDGKGSGVVDPYNHDGYEPDAFAKEVIRRMYNGEQTIVIAQRMIRFAHFVQAFSPSLCLTFIKRNKYSKNMIERFQKKD
jgi:dehydrogenase/reductase SDR family member 7B